MNDAVVTTVFNFIFFYCIIFIIFYSVPMAATLMMISSCSRLTMLTEERKVASILPFSLQKQENFWSVTSQGTHL